MRSSPSARREIAARQIDPICVPQLMTTHGPAAAPNGGSGRGYWPTYRRIGVPAIMDVHGIVASMACIFMQATVSRERAHAAEESAADGMRW